MKALLYARVSTKEQGKSGLGLEAQITEMKQFCEFHKIEIVDIRQEVVSGTYPLERRPVLKQIVEDAKKMKGCYIITNRIDRLSRKPSLIESFLDGKVDFRVVECGINVSTLEIRVKAAFAAEERQKIADRTRAAFQAKRDRGEPMGMELKKQKGMVNEIQSASIKAIKEEADSFAEFMRETIDRMLRDQMNYSDIAKYLNKHGYTTQRGGQWWPQSVKNIVSRWQ